MEKNKAVRILAIISTVMCGLFAFCVILMIIFQKELVRLLVKDIDIADIAAVIPSGAVIKLLCAAAFIVADVRLIKNKGLKENMYIACAASGTMLIGSTAAEYIQLYNLRSYVTSFVVNTILLNLAVWVQPLLLAGAVMTVVACALDIHISSRRELKPVYVKTGFGLNIAYAVIMLLVIILQGLYTGSEVFVFPMGVLIELVAALCMLAACIFMLNGAEANLPLMLSAGAFIACSFIETPVNALYTYFLTRFMDADGVAALGKVSAYTGYVSYIFLAGATVTIICSAVYITEKKNLSSGKKGRK